MSSESIAQLRDGTPVGAWMFKAHPDVWDIARALREHVSLDWWRMAPSYRVELVRPGHPCVLWITRGDPKVTSGVWAVGEITGEVYEDSGDPDDELWKDRTAQRQVRPRVPISLSVLERPLTKEVFVEDPVLAAAEIVRVPRIGNPAALSVEQWKVLEILLSSG